MRNFKFRIFDNKMCYFTLFGLSNGSLPEHGIYIENEENIMQYIELKDKNGKEIYEGDIVKCIFKGKTTFEIRKIQYELHFGSNYVLSTLDDSDIMSPYVVLCNGGTLEVIGNIYEGYKNG